jgi:hypothetical protein
LRRPWPGQHSRQIEYLQPLEWTGADRRRFERVRFCGGLAWLHNASLTYLLYISLYEMRIHYSNRSVPDYNGNCCVNDDYRAQSAMTSFQPVTAVLCALDVLKAVKPL